MSTTTSTDVVLAAGAVLWRRAGPGLEVAVIHRPRYDDWSLPKGKLDPGEHLLQTAVREVLEETGHRAVLGRPLGATSYQSMGRPKRVCYWAARAMDGAFTAGAEVDDLRWLPVEDAADALERDSDRAVLAEFARAPAPTRPLVILRHAKAMPRKSWAGEDEARPLSAEGEAQSRRLSGLLGAWSPDLVVSSPASRCLETVGPFLSSDGAVTDTAVPAEELTEAAHEKDPEAAPAALRRLLDTGRAAVVCSHRPVLPALIDVVRAASPRKLDLDLDNRPLRPAEMLVAHIADGAVVAAERQRP
jgi:8-oxo-(d)GTP phosphatase